MEKINAGCMHVYHAVLANEKTADEVQVVAAFAKCTSEILWYQCTSGEGAYILSYSVPQRGCCQVYQTQCTSVQVPLYTQCARVQVAILQKYRCVAGVQVPVHKCTSVLLSVPGEGVVHLHL